MKLPHSTLYCFKINIILLLLFDYLQDLHQFFPYLLSNIFGFDRSGGWGLCTFNRTLHSDFTPVLQFLLPGGDIFQLIAKLDADSFIYEFPIECLPVSIATTYNTNLHLKHNTYLSLCWKATTLLTLAAKHRWRVTACNCLAIFVRLSIHLSEPSCAKW